MSLDTEAEGFKTQLATATKRPVYDHDDAQKAQAAGTLDTMHTIIYVSRRFGGNDLMDGTRSTDLRRLSTRVVADTVSNARLLEDRITEAFAFSGVAYESGGGAYDFENGRYTALIDWTYTV